MPGWGLSECCRYVGYLCTCCGSCGKVDSAVPPQYPRSANVVKIGGPSPLPFPNHPDLEQPMLPNLPPGSGNPTSDQRRSPSPFDESMAGPPTFRSVAPLQSPTQPGLRRSPSPLSSGTPTSTSTEYQAAELEPDQKKIQTACYRVTMLGTSAVTTPQINKDLARTFAYWFNSPIHLLQENANDLQNNFKMDFIDRPGLLIRDNNKPDWLLYDENKSPVKYEDVCSYILGKDNGNIGWGLLALLQQHPRDYNGFQEFGVDPIFRRSPKPIFHYLFALMTANRQEMTQGTLGGQSGRDSGRTIILDFSQYPNPIAILSTKYPVQLILAPSNPPLGYQECTEMGEFVPGIFEAAVKLKYNAQQLVVVNVPYVRFTRKSQ